MPCFNESDKYDLTPGHKVFQLCPPPVSDALDKKVAFNYFPATDFVSGSSQVGTHTYTGSDVWVFLWANRYTGPDAWNRKPNLTPTPIVWYPDTNHECRVHYTSVAKANVATRVQIRYLLGRTDYAAPWVNSGWSEDDLILSDGPGGWRSDPVAVFTEAPINWTSPDGLPEVYRCTTDKVLLPDFKIPEMPSGVNCPGIVLDWEVQDSRAQGNTTNFITVISDEIHEAGKKIMLWTNPLNAPTQVHNALTPVNLPAILDKVDYLTLLLWSKNIEGNISESYNNQLSLLGPLTTEEWEKVVVIVELNITDADARWIYNKTHERNSTHPKHIFFWRNGAVQGCVKACPNNVNNIICQTLYGVPVSQKP